MKLPGVKALVLVMAAVSVPPPVLVDAARTLGPPTENRLLPSAPLRSSPNDCWVLTAWASETAIPPTEFCAATSCACDPINPPIVPPLRLSVMSWPVGW